MKNRVFNIIFFLFIICFILPAENITDRGLIVKVKALNENAVAGRQYIVFIGIDRYKHWNALKNPKKDAVEIKGILTSRYYIDNVVELYDEDATKAGIIRLFRTLIADTKPEDSVFIFYAGHGHLDNMSDTGFWIPVDGGIDIDEQENWLPNNQIRGYISKMKARHIALFSDSCFSGDILNPVRSIAPEITNDYFQKAYSRVSRQVLTSGASETVPDLSPFSRQLKLVLEGNNHPYLDPLMMYNQIRLGVTGTTPLFGNLNGSGHQNGASFLFFLKDSIESSTSSKPVLITQQKITIQSKAIPISNSMLDLQLIHPETFIMGSTGWREGSEHGVTLSKPYYMSKYEVTYQQLITVFTWAINKGYAVVSKDAISSEDGKIKYVGLSEEYPFWGKQIGIDLRGTTLLNIRGYWHYAAEGISWYGAVAFCNFLSLKEGREPVYNLDDWTWNLEKNGYRLPTEAEWEFAAAGGNNSEKFEYAGSSNADKIGWYRDNSNGSSSPVGKKDPNSLGLYDMSGNVWEWCWDWYGPYPSEPVVDPQGPVVGEQSILRGGAWHSWIGYLGINVRYAYSLYEYSRPSCGVRPVCGY